MQRPFRRFARNAAGRDFVVGDIHGMFPALRQLLARVAFDEECDRLFSVGDLIDRGPHSREALEWFAKPWFHAVRGNHEQFLLDSDDRPTRELWIRYNGGDWWLECGPAERKAFREACAALPIAIEIDATQGRVGSFTPTRRVRTRGRTSWRAWNRATNAPSSTRCGRASG